jgi:hypothetical protein
VEWELRKSSLRFWSSNQRFALAVNSLDKLARFFANSQDMKTSIPPVLITFALVCFTLVQNTRAVIPAPDGGYPGGNTAEGQNTLLSLTTGGFNTAVGFLSLRSNAIGQLNTALGAGALLANTADDNTATGAGALFSNTSGSLNTATGAFALFSNTEGNDNTATGFEALFHNTIGVNNTATGDQALSINTTGNNNTANGVAALAFNTTSNGNTAIGSVSLGANTTGNSNTAAGFLALSMNTTGGGNTAIGAFALLNNTSGFSNIVLGSAAGQNITTANNVICIGADGNNLDNSCYIGQIFGATSSGGTAVFINSNGRLGTMTSSARFKDEIKPMDNASEALFALKPVAFRYKKDIDPAGTPQLGLVAEDVEKVNPDLVVRDKEGKPYTVRYDAVNAMLLNEFLKEHRKLEQLEANATRQQKQIEALSEGLQKVSTQLEASKPAPQVVNNP